jgi:hypothetical protein
MIVVAGSITDKARRYFGFTSLHPTQAYKAE